MKRWDAYLLVVVVCFLLSGCGPPCEDIGYCEIAKQANVQVTFDEFTSTDVGGEQVREVHFESLGPGVLRVTTVELVEQAGDGEHELDAVDWDGSRWDGPVFHLEPGESASLAVAYRPKNQVEDRGYIEVITNDPDQRELRVELQPPAPRPELVVDPTTLSWDGVLPDSDPGWRGEPRSLALYNTGSAPLEISDIQLEGDDVFEWTLQQCTSDAPTGRSCPPEDDVDQLPDPILPGEAAYLRVYFQPSDRLPHSATLLVSSNSSGGATTEIPLESQ